MTVCPEGFHWIGQTFVNCDQCGRPAWDHAGMAHPRVDMLPFDSVPDSEYWVLEPWRPGEAEACRRKWEART